MISSGDGMIWQDERRDADVGIDEMGADQDVVLD
jgi:hypothetical protein